MGLEHVKESILAEARAAAEADLAKARAEAEAIRARARAKADEARAVRQQELQVAIAGLKRRELALAELEAKKLRLQAQKDLLARVRHGALEKLQKLPPKQNDDYLTALLKRSAGEGARIHARHEDKVLVERAGYTYAGPVQAVGGVVLESADGATREDLRFEYLLEDAWPEALNEVASLLFGAPQAAKAAPKGR
jgi:V/A-type H+/Na+-transporting ATPase subunit E